MKPKTKQLDISEDSLNLFEKIVTTEKNCFLLETLEDQDQPQSSSSSYIGFSPKKLFTAKNKKLKIDDQLVEVENPYFELRKHIKTDTSLAPGFIGGLVGYFSHEGISLLEPSISFDYSREFPDFQFGEYEDGVRYAPGNQPEYFYQNLDRSELLEEYGSISLPALNIDGGGPSRIQTEHEAIIESAKHDIENGRIFQVVLANKYTYSHTGDLIKLYRKLREINPSPFMFFMKFGDIITMGASPELLAHTKPSGKVYLEALAGTVRLGKNNQESKELAEGLLKDSKEIAEHSMLVDLARNDVGRISKIGSVKIENLMYIKKLSHVQHIASIVSGELAEGRDMFDSVASSFPAGTLSGAPKIEAIKMIAELEATERGPYGGTIGYFSYNGDSMHAVNIRSVSAIGSKVYLHSGSGIVYDSDAQRECQEINEKKAAMDSAMSSFSMGADYE